MSFYSLKKYLQYKLRAKDEHSIHSPFVFKLYTEVIVAKRKYPAFEVLDQIRKQLLQDETEIEVTDLGAGSKKLNNNRKVSDIAKYSVINKKYGELLFRLVDHFKPENVLELGSSLGLSSLYIAGAAPKANIVTVEGCPNTHGFARKLIEEYNKFSLLRGDEQVSFAERSNDQRGLTVVNARFDDYIETQTGNKIFDLVYIDGNHTYKATVKYFHDLLKLTNENSVLIFDDIYWSEGMTKAWKEIKTQPSVTLSIDLFKGGLIFFRKENKQKEHFVLRF